ncbi:TonB-dependent receptor plug domain-containing protein [Pseudoalteromonas denitrificans]|uniref:Vitamin B12 transporter n=1 Tax=Pseudoalteromonas denitrificans DSM 6059 TaxID=1123010 RepID=A0A1I1J4V6_9GAMM|nr:TonB-dependent receptor [Pseudoalteromonas denitrificans]SFC43554.1 vitamin B12 transporter [Pseudoalteromonas denitrificans DSM 6059]
MFNKSKTALAVVSAISLFTPSVALAQNTQFEENLEHITVTANRISQSIANTLASVSVINRADIDASNARDLVSLLNSQAGIQIDRKGGFGQTSSVLLRGSQTKHSLILVDGIRIGSATLGYKNISNLPLNAVERVEIVKGSRAAQYGSDAIAGVINVITRKNESARLSVTAGKNNYKNIQATKTINTESLTLSINAGYEKTDGFDAVERFDEDSDGYKNLNLGINLDFSLNEIGQLSLVGQYSEGETEFDVSSGNDFVEFENYFAKLGWNKTYQDINHNIDFSLSQDSDLNQHGIDWQGKSAADTQYETDRVQIDYLGQYQYSSALSFNGGINWYEEDVSETTAQYDKQSRDVFAIFVGAYFNDENYLANLSLRNDDDEQYGNELTYNLALGMHLNEKATFRLSRNTGFKAPSFNDLYFPGSGNSELNPEESVNHEVGLRIDLIKASFDVAVFNNEVKNLIEWAPAPTVEKPGRWLPSNIGSATMQGIELSASYQVFGLNNDINFTYTDAENEVTGANLANQSDKVFNWAIAKDWQQISVSLDFQYRSSRPGKYYNSDFSVNKLSAYTLWNLATSYQINDDLSVKMRVENLFDKEYQASEAAQDWSTSEISYYKTAERHLFVGVDYNF